VTTDDDPRALLLGVAHVGVDDPRLLVEGHGAHVHGAAPCPLLPLARRLASPVAQRSTRITATLLQSVSGLDRDAADKLRALTPAPGEAAGIGGVAAALVASAHEGSVIASGLARGRGALKQRTRRFDRAQHELLVASRSSGLQPAVLAGCL